MKITAIILLSACLTASANGYSQKVTLSEKNAHLEKVFINIKQQTGYEFLYTYELLQKAERITIELKSVELQDALKTIFKDQPLTFSIIEKTVVIKPKAYQIKAEEITPPIDVKGRILNESGEPVIANVSVKGTSNGTTSNSDGFFELKRVDENATLVITSVSIETIELKVSGRAEIIIIAKIKIAEGQDVTVKTNYWETSQKLNPGNISKIAAKQIETNPVSNPLAALQGRVPGLEITQLTGVPGGNFTVRVRGQNSIAKGNDPLYIVDGVPYTSTSMGFSETSGGILINGTNPMNYIDPLSIESIEVLKDADATAIYGSRGANGVILITTKKGKAGKTKIDARIYTGASKVGHKMDLLSTEQYLKIRREGFRNDSRAITTSSAPDLLLWDTTRYTDWQKELIGGTANTTDAQLSISGGASNMQFVIGAGYHRETTVFPGDNSEQRASAHFALTNFSVDRKLYTSVTVNYSSLLTNLLNTDLTSAALTLVPIAPALYNSTGELNWQNNTWSNPLVNLIRVYEAKTKNLIANAQIRYSILKDLDSKISLGYTNTTMNAVTTTPNRWYGPISGPSIPHETNFANSNFGNWIIEPQLNWKRGFSFGSIDILVGSTFMEQISQGTALTGKGFSNEALMKNIFAASQIIAGTDYYRQYKYNAIFGRFNYIAKEKYVLNLTGRRDGSSRFGPDKQFANFFAVGTAWVFTKENFFNNIRGISFGKLRISYGVSGNDQLGDYEFLDTYTSGPVYMGNPSLQPVRLYSPDFAWEINRKFEAGLEIAFSNNRFSTEFSYYRNRSSNQLVGYPLPSTTGFTSIQDNFPATVQNTGFEIEISSSNIDRKNFTWITSLNLSIPRNKLISFPDLSQSPSYANRLIVGKPISIAKLYHYTGINPQTGTYTVMDMNYDGAFNQADQQVVRFIGQDFFGGLQNSLEYKGFQFDVLFQFVKQTGRNIYSAFGAPGTQNNQPIQIIDGRWQKSGDIALFQLYTTSTSVTPFSRYTSSDASVINTSFVRLKNLSLSYTIPVKWLKRIKVENVKIFLQAQNLVTFTNYKGLDPEFPNSTFLPPLQVIAAGINLTL